MATRSISRGFTKRIGFAVILSLLSQTASSQTLTHRQTIRSARP